MDNKDLRRLRIEEVVDGESYTFYKINHKGIDVQIEYYIEDNKIQFSINEVVHNFVLNVDESFIGTYEFYEELDVAVNNHRDYVKKLFGK